MVMYYIVKPVGDICISYTLLFCILYTLFYGGIADGVSEIWLNNRAISSCHSIFVHNTLSRILDRFVKRDCKARDDAC